MVESAGMIPTAEQERTKREVGIMGALTNALRTIPDIVDAQVAVTLPPDNPLWKAPNLIISPHVSSSSDLPREQRWILAREQIRRYAAGKKMLSVVDLKREY